MKPKFKQTSHILAAFTLSSLAASLSAQIVWDGSTSTDFEDGTNWVGDIAPIDDDFTDIAQFTGGIVDLTSARQIGGIDLNTATTLAGTGSLQVGASGISGAADLSITGGSSVNFTQADGALNYTGNIFVGAGSTLSANRNALKLDIATYTTDTLITLDGGTISENGGEHLDLAGRDIVLNAGGGTLRHVHARNIFGGYLISGVGQLTMEGQNSDSGRVQLTETNTYTGGSVVTNGGQAWIYNNNSLGANDTPVALDTGGTLFFANNSNLGQRVVTVNAGGGTFNMNNKSAQISAGVVGSGDLEIHNGGVLEWYADSNAYSGNILVDNGTELRVRTGVADMLGTGVITLDNGAFIKNRNNSPTINNDIVIGAGGGGVEVGWANRRIQLNGVVSGDGLLTISNDSSSTRLVNEGNSYTGGTLVQGYVNASSGGFGTGDITLDNVEGGTTRGGIQNYNGAATHTNNLNVSANGGRLKAGWNANLEFTGVVSGSGQLAIQEDSGRVVMSNAANTFSGDITFDGADSRITVGSLGGGDFSGTTSGDGTINFAVAGTQIISSSLAHNGATEVTGGGLLSVNGAFTGTGTMFVKEGATVGGIGSLGITNIESTGNIAPGNSTGTLSTKNLTLAGAYEAEITGAANDTIAVTGTADVSAGTLNLVLSGIYTFGQEFILIDNDEADAIVAFSGLAEGANAATHRGMDLIASYTMGDGNDFGLTAVPEPSSSLLAGLGALALLRRRRA